MGHYTVVELPSTTKPCPVNFMLSSPQAKTLLVSMDGFEGTVSVEGLKQITSHCLYNLKCCI